MFEKTKGVKISLLALMFPGLLSLQLSYGIALDDKQYNQKQHSHSPVAMISRILVYTSMKLVDTCKKPQVDGKVEVEVLVGAIVVVVVVVSGVVKSIEC